MTNTTSPLGVFEDPVGCGLTGIVLDVATKVGGAFVEMIKDKRQAKAALERYEAKYRQRYGSVRILGMKQDYPLEQVYTKVKFLDALSIRRFESVEALEEVYRGKSVRGFTTQERTPQDGTGVVNAHPKLTVLGQPGAGKSTFLRRLGLAAFQDQAENSFMFQCIPVLLELKRFNPTQIDLLGAVAKELANFGFPETPEYAAKALEQGNLLVLLDGLDKVPKDIFNPAIEAIQDFVTRYDQTRFITSCRTAAHRSDFRRFTNVELADFDDEPIEAFTHNWFQTELDKESSTAERCWEQLNDQRNSVAKELAQIFTRQVLTDQINDFIEGTADKPALPGKDILDAIAEQQGIFAERAEDVYSFSHLTLQEYLTAQYISQDTSLTSELLKKYLLEDRWREVFLLIPGLLRNADGYLLKMQTITQTYLDMPKLRALISWANEAAASSKSNYKLAAERVAAILLDRTRYRDRDRASGLIHDHAIVLVVDLVFDPTLAQEPYQMRISGTINFPDLAIRFEALERRVKDASKTAKVCSEFIFRLHQPWLQESDLNFDTATLSNEECLSFSHYLKANQFILKCKDSAIRVSKQVWESIEN
ncbi:hypothetical protein C7271_12760 [filamentous cyanobacterium CCP5]|nr:hypothetical protein C7271_12760 [filamentous cyanobacterium CCP5]